MTTDGTPVRRLRTRDVDATPPASHVDEVSDEALPHPLPPLPLDDPALRDYTIRRELGGGGMSRLFLADELRLGRRVVIKVLAPTLAETLVAHSKLAESIADVQAVIDHDALERLAAFDPDQARLVELRYFGGLGIEDTAEALGVSPATVKREWAVARAWLRRELEGA